MNINHTGTEYEVWILLPQNMVLWLCCKHGNEPSGSIQWGERGRGWVSLTRWEV